MGKVKYFTITFANQAGIYNPGQQVTGEVNLQVQQEVKIRGMLDNYSIYIKSENIMTLNWVTLNLYTYNSSIQKRNMFSTQ